MQTVLTWFYVRMRQRPLRQQPDDSEPGSLQRIDTTEAAVSCVQWTGQSINQLANGWVSLSTLNQILKVEILAWAQEPECERSEDSSGGPLWPTYQAQFTVRRRIAAQQKTSGLLARLQSSTESTFYTLLFFCCFVLFFLPSFYRSDAWTKTAWQRCPQASSTRWALSNICKRIVMK